MKAILSIDALLKEIILVYLFYINNIQNINKRKVEGHYPEYFMQVMNLKIILFMHFCHRLVPCMHIVIYA